MSIYKNNNLINTLLIYSPIILLFISALNEFDFNYLGLKYFSFNFSYILIFYYSLKKDKGFGYGLVFIAGLFNDVVSGAPIGISSLSFLLICGFAAYLRNITLRPSLIKDGIFFLFTILFVQSLTHLSLNLFFLFKLDYDILVTNLIFTFLLYFPFSYLFDVYSKIVFRGLHD
jgi:rod shape-determining protein MreD